jgi:adenylate kinase
MMIRSAITAALGAAIATSIVMAQFSPPKIIVLVGPPGSGKTTQARILAKKYRIPAFSVSDLLKKQMASRPNDPVLAAAVASGELLPDDAASDLIKDHLLRADLHKGFILDGYPASAVQAKALDQMLQDQQLPPAIVVLLDASDDVIRKRMKARRQADDKPEMIEQRIQEFRNEASLLAAWAGQSRVVRVNANASIASVSAQIMAGLEDAWSNPTLKQRP